MKATGIVVSLSIIAAAGLAVCLVLERQAGLKLDAQNDALRRQLSQMTELTSENQRLSNLLARANAGDSNPNGTAGTNATRDERLEELARLRSQVEAFRHQSNDAAGLLADTRATRDALKETQQAQLANRKPDPRDPGVNNGAPFEILEAHYGTDRTNTEVSAALNDRIRGGSLKIIAGNNLAGDPDFGQTKNLTVVYRFGGATLTNQFREGDVVVLPPQPPPDAP